MGSVEREGVDGRPVIGRMFVSLPFHEQISMGISCTLFSICSLAPKVYIQQRRRQTHL